MEGVTEAAVFPDRLELRGDFGWRGIPFSSFIQREPPGLADRLWRWLKLPAKLGRVAEIRFCRERYADSFVRFLTTPRITLHMPEKGPFRFPHSHFWRVQQTIRSGGYVVDDLDGPRPKPDPLDGLPRGVRRAVEGAVALCILNFLAFAVIAACIGGDAINGKVENGRYYLRSKRRLTEVSKGVWTYSRWHSISTVVAFPLAFVVAAGAAAAAKGRPTATKRPDAAPPAAPNRSPTSKEAGHPVAHGRVIP